MYFYIKVYIILHKLPFFIIEHPSAAAGIILHLFDLQLIPKATQWFLSNSAHTSDEDIKRGVRTLVDWIKYSNFVKNLQHWIIGILTALREQQKYDLLLEIAEANFENLEMLSCIPVYYNDCIMIIILILTSVQHRSYFFHRFIKRYTLKYISGLSKNKVDLGLLKDTLMALMLHFPAETQEMEIEYNRVVSFLNDKKVPKINHFISHWNNYSEN